MLEEALTKVGGKVLDTTNKGRGKNYLMSTQVNQIAVPDPLAIDQQYYYKGYTYSKGYGANITGRIRPFIKY